MQQGKSTSFLPLFWNSLLVLRGGVGGDMIYLTQMAAARAENVCGRHG